jgi:hypothetical protein
MKDLRPRRLVPLIVVLCLLVGVAAGAVRATTAPVETYGVHVFLTDKGVTFAPKRLTPNTNITYLLTVWNNSRVVRSFRFAKLRTAPITPGHHLSIIYPFRYAGTVHWASQPQGAGKTYTGKIRVRAGSVLPNTGVPGFQ